MSEREALAQLLSCLVAFAYTQGGGPAEPGISLDEGLAAVELDGHVFDVRIEARA